MLVAERDRAYGVAFAGIAVVLFPAVALVVGVPTSGGVAAATTSLDGVVGADDTDEAAVSRGNPHALRRIEAYGPEIRRASAAAGVDPYLVGGIVYAESRGRSGQTSTRGALGLMQLTLAAARDAARRSGKDLPEDDERLTALLLHDDPLNLTLGAAHLAWLLEHRGEWSLEAVLVSYNAGRRRLFQWIGHAGTFDAWARDEAARDARGEPSKGAYAYARRVLRIRDELRSRGRL